MESASYTEAVTFSHESWRGRIRACNGVGAALEPEEVAALDGELARLLAEAYPGALAVPHRIFIATGRSAGPPPRPRRGLELERTRS